MYEHDLRPFDEGLVHLADVGIGGAVADLQSLGFRPVTAVCGTMRLGDTFDQLLAMLGDSDATMRAEIEALEAETEARAKEPSWDVYLADPDGASLVLLARQEGAVSHELVTTFASGAQAVTVGVTDRNRHLFGTDAPESWPEGGSWWNYHELGAGREGLQGLVDAHRSIVRTIAATEGLPDAHAVPDDVAMYLRNSGRLSANHGSWVGLQEDDERDEHEVEELSADAAGIVAGMWVVWNRHQQREEAMDLARAVERVPVATLRSWPVEGAASAGAVGRWAHWSDERFAQAGEMHALLEQGELPIPADQLAVLVRELLDDLAQQHDHAVASEASVAAFVTLFQAVARHVDLNDPLGEDAPPQLPEELITGIRRAFEGLGWR